MIPASEDSESELIPSKWEMEQYLLNILKPAPTSDEISEHILYALKHSMSFEYIMYGHPELDNQDRQKPHDLIGPGNKLVWAVMGRLSKQDRIPKNYYQNPQIRNILEQSLAYKNGIFEGVDLHNLQPHHRDWKNGLDIPEANVIEYAAGAIDAIIANLEPRSYLGGAHNNYQIMEIIKSKKLEQPNKCEVMEIIFELILPDLVDRIREAEITSLKTMKNVLNLPDNVYNLIAQRINYTVEMLKHFGYHNLE